MMNATRRAHKVMDSLVHPTVPFMGSYPHSGQIVWLLLLGITKCNRDCPWQGQRVIL